MTSRGSRTGTGVETRIRATLDDGGAGAHRCQGSDGGRVPHVRRLVAVKQQTIPGSRLVGRMRLRRVALVVTCGGTPHQTVLARTGRSVGRRYALGPQGQPKLVAEQLALRTPARVGFAVNGAALDQIDEERRVTAGAEKIPGVQTAFA